MSASPSSQPNGPVVVLGATNRPNDLDKAFLRRMPVQIRMKMPDSKDRIAILKAQLSRERVAADVDLEDIALGLENCTGSDIRELIRVASLQRTKASLRDMELLATSDMSNMNNQDDAQLRPLSAADFDYAVDKWRRTGKKSFELLCLSVDIAWEIPSWAINVCNV